MIANTFLKKTLLFNLIFFDFILLESSGNRVSNFFLEKYLKKKNFLFRISLFELFPAFKQFIKLFFFLKNSKKKSFIYFWFFSEHTLEFFESFFKKKNFENMTSFHLFFPSILKTTKSKNYINNVILFDQYLSNHEFFSFLYKRLFLIQYINCFEKFNWYTYNIFADLNDYKKLIFICALCHTLLNKI